MTLTGHILGGQLVLDGPVGLPDGAAVRVELVTIPTTEAAPADPPVVLRERLNSFLSHPPLDLPPDAAEHHDRYLYGGNEQ